MLCRHRSLATTMMVIAAFAIAAMHIGMPDHPMTMTTTMTRDDMPSSAVKHDSSMDAAAQADRLPSDETEHHTPGALAISMTCQLLVLLAAGGCVMRRLVSRRNSHRAALARSRRVLAQLCRTERPARPPGLRMLCVAIC